jgi:hypothetical protein
MIVQGLFHFLRTQEAILQKKLVNCIFKNGKKLNSALVVVSKESEEGTE